MAHFTNEIIDQCEISSCKSYLDQGVHQKWVFEVFDPSTGDVYSLEDTSLAANASNEDLIAKVRELLLVTEHISIEPNTAEINSNQEVTGKLA